MIKDSVLMIIVITITHIIIMLIVIIMMILMIMIMLITNIIRRPSRSAPCTRSRPRRSRRPPTEH